MENTLKSRMIKNKAEELGFFLCGITRAEHMDEETRRLESWLNQGFQGQMSYLENHFDKRVDPSKLVPGAKSVVSLAYNYFNPETQADAQAPKISMYAYGKDYHKVVRKKLDLLMAFVRDTFGQVEGRVFVDSAPVLERDLARRAGLGWIGKNTMLINPRKGSYFFLGEMIIDLDLAYDDPMTDYCGTCRRCIDACPTDAINQNGYFMDGSKCISYLTIELKDEIPYEFRGRMENRMFGCDICQQVCPWNRFSEPHGESQFLPSGEWMGMTNNEWKALTEETFGRLFGGSAVKRAKYEGLMRNIRFLDDK